MGTFTIGLVVAVVLVGWRVQEHEGEHVEIPHAVDAGEEGAVHLDRDGPPLPVAFCHLSRENRHGQAIRRSKCCKDTALEEISENSTTSTGRRKWSVTGSVRQKSGWDSPLQTQSAGKKCS